MKLFYVCGLFLLLLASCSISKEISKPASKLFNNPSLQNAHVGISIYDPATGKYWYNHDADRYFVPASNTKLFSLYAGMKFLGDSLPGLKIFETSDKLNLIGTGDPTLLHPAFSQQPVIDFLARSNKQLWGTSLPFNTTAYGRGWHWDDYNESYMNERSQLPVFGNNIVFYGTKNNIQFFPKAPVTFPASYIQSTSGATGFINQVKRNQHKNEFIIHINGNKEQKIVVPFITSDDLSFQIIADTIHKLIVSPNQPPVPDNPNEPATKYVIYSRPSDSMFRPMMHESDNFFAEQTLLMASNIHLGYMNDRRMIDTLLKKELKDIPQKPSWVDGSGLSRYNLFTPMDFVFILDKLKNEFGLERIKYILPKGGTGTLREYYRSDTPFVYAKTGTLSNHCALSGYLITRKNKLLIFSILANHYTSGATPVRKAIEQFLGEIRDKY